MKINFDFNLSLSLESWRSFPQCSADVKTLQSDGKRRVEHCREDQEEPCVKNYFPCFEAKKEFGSNLDIKSVGKSVDFNVVLPLPRAHVVKHHLCSSNVCGEKKDVIIFAEEVTR